MGTAEVSPEGRFPEMPLVAEVLSAAGSPEEAIQSLKHRGFGELQANAGVQIFMAHNSLETEGIFKGLTGRQKWLAMLDASNNLYLGATPEDTIKALLAEGYTLEQATAAVEVYLAKSRAERHLGAPAMAITGGLVAGIGILATALSQSAHSNYSRVYVGAIVGGVIMMLVGIYRRMD